MSTFDNEQTIAHAFDAVGPEATPVEDVQETASTADQLRTLHTDLLTMMGIAIGYHAEKISDKDVKAALLEQRALIQLELESFSGREIGADEINPNDPANIEGFRTYFGQIATAPTEISVTLDNRGQI